MATKLRFSHVQELPAWAGSVPCAGGRCTELAAHVLVRELTSELQVNTPLCCQCLFELFGFDAAGQAAIAAAAPLLPTVLVAAAGVPEAELVAAVA